MSKIKKIRSPQRSSGPLIVGKSQFGFDDLTKAQRTAMELFEKWFYGKKSSKEQILRIGGGAGVGKGVLLRTLLEHYGFDGKNCMVMGYTGQSVNVLRQYGVMANTIHSSIMQGVEEPVLDGEGNPVKHRGVPAVRVRFRPVRKLPSSVELLVVDEASFLPRSLEDIMTRYNIPILEIGDPIQLPPVGDKQCFTMDNLNYFMEGVMRQHRDSEIYDFATRLRHYKNVPLERYINGEVRFLYQQETIEDTFYRYLPFFRHADQIIVSTNRQRQIITDLYRAEILKTSSPYPIKGERMICRKNNHGMMIDQFMLVNGMMGTCLETVGRSMIERSTGIYFMDFQPDVVAHTGLYFSDMICDSDFLAQPFGEATNSLMSFPHPGEKMEFAHAITVHGAQGSQWPSVIYMDSYGGDPEYIMRRRYTAATRAREKLMYLAPYTRYPGWTDLRNIEARSRDQR